MRHDGKQILYRFIFLPRRSRRTSRWYMTGEVRFRLWSHPGHVSYLIGATPLNCLRCTIARRRLTHCDYASRLSRDFILGRFIFSFRLLFFPPIFIPFALRFDPRCRSVDRLAIRSKHSSLPFFVSREIPRKEIKRNVSNVLSSKNWNYICIQFSNNQWRIKLTESLNNHLNGSSAI